ncbi:hypothetical protein BDR22DRAFT_102870 [Usnea florida]
MNIEQESTMSSTPAELNPAQLSSTPIQPPPKGVQSNFGDAENNNKPMFGVSSLFLAITIGFFINRIYTKSYIVRRLSWDDLTITFAFLGSIIIFVACIWGGKLGRIGYHNWDVSIEQTTRKDFIIPIWIMTAFPPVVYLFLKNTFFIMYLYIFGPLRWLRICAYIGAAITTVFYISVSVASFVFVTPRHGETWVEHLYSKEETRSTILPVPISSFGVVIDLVILILPIIAVIQVQLPTRRKIAVIAVFMTGSLACLFSILGIYFRKKEDDELNNSNWQNTAVNIVTILEIFVGIICACTPAAAKSGNYHLKNLSALSLFVVAQLSRIRLSTKQSQASLLSRTGNHQPGQYSNIDIYQGPGRLGQAQNKNVRTFIHRGKQQDLENDGIHLTFEMHDQVSQLHHPIHETATSLGQVDTNYDGLGIKQSPSK